MIAGMCHLSPWSGNAGACFILVVIILHISDPHAQTETMERLHNLASAQADCDVVALTGDCVSQSSQQLPQEWNSWPQALMLSVPGNHDAPSTFDKLHGWVCHAPYDRHADRDRSHQPEAGPRLPRMGQQISVSDLVASSGAPERSSL